MRCLLLIALFSAATAVHGTDPLAALSDNVERGDWVEKQVRQFVDRMDGHKNPSCDEALAPVEGPSGATSAYKAVYALAQVTDLLKSKLDVVCMNGLVQELARHDDPVSARLIVTLSSRRLGPAQSRYLSTQERYCNATGMEFQSIEDLLAAAAPLAACAALKPGQHRVIDGLSAYGNQLNYTLLAEAPKRHRVLLHARFANDREGVMRRRVEQCLAAVGPHLRSPNGNQLAFSILDDAGARRLDRASRPKPVTINVRAAGTRNHSRAYAADIDCPTIVHEVLHLVGLSDEYHGEPDQAHCRAAGEDDSIMRDQNRAFHLRVPRRVTCRMHEDLSQSGRLIIRNSPLAQQFLRRPSLKSYVGNGFLNAYCQAPQLDSANRRSINRRPQPERVTFSSDGTDGIILTGWEFSTGIGDLVRVSYRCRCSDDVCRRTRQQLLSEPMAQFPEDCTYPLLPEAVVWGNREATFAVQGDNISFGVSADGGALLSNAHIREALSHGCQGANATYRTCAQRAYQASCGPLPAQCSGNWAR